MKGDCEMKWERAYTNCYTLNLDDCKIVAKYNFDAENGVGSLDKTFFSFNVCQNGYDIESITYYPFSCNHLSLINEPRHLMLHWNKFKDAEGLPEIIKNQLYIIFLLIYGKNYHILDRFS